MTGSFVVAGGECLVDDMSDWLAGPFNVRLQKIRITLATLRSLNWAYWVSHTDDALISPTLACSSARC